MALLCGTIGKDGKVSRRFVEASELELRIEASP
jgi:hypothetical protein